MAIRLSCNSGRLSSCPRIGANPGSPDESLSPARARVGGAAWPLQRDCGLPAFLGMSTRTGPPGAWRARPGVRHGLGSMGARSGQQTPRHHSVAARGSSSMVLLSPTCTSPPWSWGKAGGNQTSKKVFFGMMNPLEGARDTCGAAAPAAAASAACAGWEEAATGPAPVWGSTEPRSPGASTAHAAAADPSQEHRCRGALHQAPRRRSRGQGPAASGGSLETSPPPPRHGEGTLPLVVLAQEQAGLGLASSMRGLPQPLDPRLQPCVRPCCCWSQSQRWSMRVPKMHEQPRVCTGKRNSHKWLWEEQEPPWGRADAGLRGVWRWVAAVSLSTGQQRGHGLAVAPGSTPRQPAASGTQQEDGQPCGRASLGWLGSGWRVSALSTQNLLGGGWSSF